MRGRDVFLLVPYAIKRQLRSVPWVTLTVIVLNLAVYSIPASRDRWLAGLGFSAGPAGLLTWLTSAFLHSGPLPLLFGLYFLWVFGSYVEDVIGHVRFAVLYLLGAFSSSMAYAALALTLFPSAATVPMVGSAGAIAAVMGLFVVRFRGAGLRIWYFWFLLLRFRAGTMVKSALIGVAIWLTAEAVSALPVIGGPTAFVAALAHVGGFLFGVSGGMLLGLSGQAAEERLDEDANRYASVGLGNIAAARWEKLYARNPAEPRPLIEQARALASSDPPNEEAAARALTRAVEALAPTDRRHEALLLYEELRGSVGPWALEPRVLISLAGIAESISANEEAAAVYGDLLQHHSECDEAEKARFRVPHVLLAMGDDERARREWRNFIGRHPQSRWIPYADTSLLTM